MEKGGHWKEDWFCDPKPLCGPNPRATEGRREVILSAAPP